VQQSAQHIRIVLVAPEYPGNVGYVARVMANFGVEELFLVKGCEITDEARDRAVHAQAILNNARRVGLLQEALDGVDLAVGTTAILAVPDKIVWRNSIPIREGAALVRGAGPKIALVFGRESRGLLNDELEHLDLLLTIPTNDAYPSLNVSHAVAVALYELSQAVRRIPEQELATRADREALLDRFEELMAAQGLPAWKVARNRIVFRRLLGRPGLTKWEFHSMSGVVRRAKDEFTGRRRGRRSPPKK
jgi:tRNA/rRNA methyltransferase